jgi:hypothetical protein
MEVIAELATNNLLQVAPSALSVVLLWRIRSLEIELFRVSELLIKHLEFHSRVGPATVRETSNN